MLALCKRNQTIVGIMLALLMAATRGHHFASLDHLPSASWAVFFLAGVYLRPRMVFPIMLGEAAILDYAAITWGGVSAFCVSPAYGLLIPAYAALWLAGRWYARRFSFCPKTLMPLSMSLFAGAIICELFSSGGFYFFSGRFAEPTLVEFAGRIVKYFPAYIHSLVFYVGLAALAHVGITLAPKSLGTSRIQAN